MGKITDIVKAWADKQWDSPPAFETTPDGESTTLRFTSSPGDFTYQAFLKVIESLDRLELFLIAAITVPVKKRSAVAEALARANYRTFGGRLDLDMSDGEIRFRIGIDVEGGELSPEMVSNLLAMGNTTLDRYLPALMAVVYANTSPADAIEHIHLDVSAPPSAPEATPTDNALPWERISGADLLQPWAQDLRSACALKDDAEWRDVGRAVVLVLDESSRCQPALERVAVEAGMRYVHIETDNVTDLPPYSVFAKLAPALIFLEPGTWLLDRQKDETDETTAARNNFQQRLVEWMGEFDVKHPLVLCTSVLQLGDMANCMDGAGRFDRYFVLPPLSLVARGEEFIEKLGSERCGESLTLFPAKLGKLLENGFANTGRRDLALLGLRRLHKRAQRRVEFLDLMHISTHGFGEEAVLPTSNDDIHRQIAAHEAGHAAMAILDSAGRNIPDYCSIVPGVGFRGVVAESISYHQSLGDRTTYADFRHDIRISLAGRAAEELVFGAERISNGASGDLKNVWERSMQAFARWGFAPQMEKANASSANLAVIVGNPTSTESAYVESNIRQFLAGEYAVVLACLAQHRAFLDAITERLLWDPIVDQTELATLYQTQRSLDNPTPT